VRNGAQEVIILTRIGVGLVECLKIDPSSVEHKNPLPGSCRTKSIKQNWDWNRFSIATKETPSVSSVTRLELLMDVIYAHRNEMEMLLGGSRL